MAIMEVIGMAVYLVVYILQAWQYFWGIRQVCKDLESHQQAILSGSISNKALFV